MEAFPDYVTKKRKVKVTEVQRSYIVVELSKFATKDIKARFAAGLRKKLESFGQEDIKKLTKALSKTYRENAVFDYTAQCEWSAVTAPVSRIYLTSTNKKENAILKRLPNPWNLESLVEELKKGETKGLESFQDRGDVIVESKVIGVFKSGEEGEELKIRIIDGMHRLPTLVRRNTLREVSLYLGVGDKEAMEG